MHEGRATITRGDRVIALRALSAAELAGGARQPLAWLEPADHGRLIYAELGLYAGEPPGTPWDGRP